MNINFFQELKLKLIDLNEYLFLKLKLKLKSETLHPLDPSPQLLYPSLNSESDQVMAAVCVACAGVGRKRPVKTRLVNFQPRQAQFVFEHTLIAVIQLLCY